MQIPKGKSQESIFNKLPHNPLLFGKVSHVQKGEKDVYSDLMKPTNQVLVCRTAFGIHCFEFPYMSVSLIPFKKLR